MSIKVRYYLLLLLSGTISYLFAQTPIDTTAFSAVEWRNVGPWRGGRSSTVCGIPGKPNTFFFGSSGGGVWKTDNGGNSWKNLSDGYFGGSIGAVAVAPSDPNVILAGQGEETLRGNVSSGNGVWKTEDGGMSWKPLGLEKTRHISRIRIHPNHPEIIYVSAIGDLWKDSPDRGVYKTTDGGAHWRKVLYINDSTAIADLAMDPGNPRILYATSWNVRRTPYSFSSGGPDGGLWKSTDSGETWTNISKNKGLPGGLWGISGVAPSGAKPGRIWAIIENKDGGVFRSENYGRTWKKVNSDRSLRQRAWYYSRIYADPVDADKVYVLNVRFHVSKDGGKSFRRMGTPHGDHHDLWIDPLVPGRMIIADDGGAQISRDGGHNWTTYHNQPTAQFYRVTVDNSFPFRIYGAQQDNSAIRIRHRSYGHSITDKDWESTAGGESAFLAPDPNDPDIVYGGSYGGFLTRYNHHNKRNRAIHVWPDNPLGAGVEVMKYRFNWNFPVFISPNNPKRLYAASNHLHVSTDEGQTWTTISPDLTTNDSTKQRSSGGPITKDNTAVEYYCTITTAAESPTKEGVIWTGSDDGKVYVTRDNGQHWEDATPAGLPPFTLVNCVEPDPKHPAACYIAATRYKWGDYRPMLYKTTDYGRTWTAINTGIAAEHFTRAIRVDPGMRGLLYAGTEYGIYASWDDGAHWQPIQRNLPTVPITDLIVKDASLIVATQGRGFWIIDDLTPIRSAKDFAREDKLHLLPPKPAYRMPGGQAKKPLNAGKNHPAGAMIYYHIMTDSIRKDDTVHLCFYDNNDHLIRCFSNHPKDKKDKMEVLPGANLFVWNMRYPSAEKFDKMIMWWGSLNGPRILPGDYSVRLGYHGDSLSRHFEVRKDPNTEAGAQDMAAQLDFIRTNNQVLTEAHRTITHIREIKGQMKDLLRRMKGSEGYEMVDSMAHGIDSTLTSIEQTLYQTKLKSSQDPLNFPIKLNNKLAHLNALIEMNDFGPTGSMQAVGAQLRTKIQEQVDKYHHIVNTKLKDLNRKIIEAEIDVIRPLDDKVE